MPSLQLTSDNILYTGLRLPKKYQKENVLHLPLIETCVRDQAKDEIEKALPVATHILFTSQTAVELFPFPYGEKTIIALGSRTASKVGRCQALHVASEETAEGVAKLLESLEIQGHILYPHSALSRDLLSTFLDNRQIPCSDIILYDTFPKQPKTPINLNLFSEIVFTSPSTVDAFVAFFGPLPQNKIITTIGPITRLKISLLIQ